jgi:lipooligosaccharide transport system ATP-binding protein
MSPDVGDSHTVQAREGQPRERQPREGQPLEGQPQEDGLAGVVRQAVVRPPRAAEPRSAVTPGPAVIPRSAVTPGSAAKPLSAAAARNPRASSASGPILVHARGLTKRYGDFTAVDRIDFDLIRGEAFGCLGPNGAGKSSTMRMIGCVSPPSAGTLRILGLDPVADGPAIRARLGVVPQEDTLDVELTVGENLLIYGRYFGLRRDVIRERAAGLLDFVQLSDRADDKVESLSGGMKRRLTIARSLINEPEILLLDEPTTGLDPQARHALWDRLFRLKQQGVTLILTTHYMDEAEQLCDRLVVMDAGHVAAEGSPYELIGRYSTAG